MRKFVIFANIFLVFIVLAMIAMGASSAANSEVVPYERFTDSKSSEKFTAIEEELFADLKNNKLSNKDIQKLIVDGVLTDTMVDKFLSRISIPKLVKKTQASAAALVATKPAQAPAQAQAPKAPPPPSPAATGIEKFDDRWASF